MNIKGRNKLILRVITLVTASIFTFAQSNLVWAINLEKYVVTKDSFNSQAQARPNSFLFQGSAPKLSVSSAVPIISTPPTKPVSFGSKAMAINQPVEWPTTATFVQPKPTSFSQIQGQQQQFQQQTRVTSHLQPQITVQEPLIKTQISTPKATNISGLDIFGSRQILPAQDVNPTVKEDVFTGNDIRQGLNDFTLRTAQGLESLSNKVITYAQNLAKTVIQAPKLVSNWVKNVGMNCASWAVTTVLNSFGIKVTEGEIATVTTLTELSNGSANSGETSFTTMIEVAREEDVILYAGETNYEKLQDIPLPFIAQVEGESGQGHYVVVTKIDENGVAAIDNGGEATFTEENFTGYILTSQKPSEGEYRELDPEEAKGIAGSQPGDLPGIVTNNWHNEPFPGIGMGMGGGMGGNEGGYYGEYYGGYDDGIGMGGGIGMGPSNNLGLAPHDSGMMSGSSLIPFSSSFDNDSGWDWGTSDSSGGIIYTDIFGNEYNFGHDYSGDSDDSYSDSGSAGDIIYTDSFGNEYNFGHDYSDNGGYFNDSDETALLESASSDSGSPSSSDLGLSSYSGLMYDPTAHNPLALSSSVLIDSTITDSSSSFGNDFWSIIYTDDPYDDGGYHDDSDSPSSSHGEVTSHMRIFNDEGDLIEEEYQYAEGNNAQILFVVPENLLEETDGIANEYSSESTSVVIFPNDPREPRAEAAGELIGEVLNLPGQSESLTIVCFSAGCNTVLEAVATDNDGLFEEVNIIAIEPSCWGSRYATGKSDSWVFGLPGMEKLQPVTENMDSSASSFILIDELPYLSEKTDGIQVFLVEGSDYHPEEGGWFFKWPEEAIESHQEFTEQPYVQIIPVAPNIDSSSNSDNSDESKQPNAHTEPFDHPENYPIIWESLSHDSDSSSHGEVTSHMRIFNGEGDLIEEEYQYADFSSHHDSGMMMSGPVLPYDSVMTSPDDHSHSSGSDRSFWGSVKYWGKQVVKIGANIFYFGAGALAGIVLDTGDGAINGQPLGGAFLNAVEESWIGKTFDFVVSGGERLFRSPEDYITVTTPYEGAQATVHPDDLLDEPGEGLLNLAFNDIQVKGPDDKVYWVDGDDLLKNTDSYKIAASALVKLAIIQSGKILLR